MSQCIRNSSARGRLNRPWRWSSLHDGASSSRQTFWSRLSRSRFASGVAARRNTWFLTRSIASSGVPCAFSDSKISCALSPSSSSMIHEFQMRAQQTVECFYVALTVGLVDVRELIVELAGEEAVRLLDFVIRIVRCREWAGRVHDGLIRGSVHIRRP